MGTIACSVCRQNTEPKLVDPVQCADQEARLRYKTCIACGTEVTDSTAKKVSYRTLWNEHCFKLLVYKIRELEHECQCAVDYGDDTPFDIRDEY